MARQGSVEEEKKIDILCVGPEASGKTLLLKCLQHYHANDRIWEIGEIPAHIPTIGSNFVTWDLKQPTATKTKRKKPQEVTIDIQEMGGQMAPIWHNSYKECQALMFVIDSANPFQISSATCLLQDCLSHGDLGNKHFLIIFAKTDIEGPVTTIELQNMMFYENIVEEYLSVQTSIETAECSVISGQGIETVLTWITELSTKKHLEHKI